MSGILCGVLGSPKVSLLANDTSTATATHPSSATAFAILGNNGQVQSTDNSPYPWLTGGSAGAYEVNATLNSGSVTGTFGSWLNLGTNQSWSLTRSTIGTSTGSITWQIRPVGGSVIASGTVAFNCTVN